MIRIEDLKIPASVTPDVRELLIANVEMINIASSLAPHISHTWSAKGLMAMMRAVDDNYSPMCQNLAHTAMEGYFRLSCILADHPELVHNESVQRLINSIVRLEVTFEYIHAAECGRPMSVIGEAVTLH